MDAPDALQHRRSDQMASTDLHPEADRGSDRDRGPDPALAPGQSLPPDAPTPTTPHQPPRAGSCFRTTSPAACPHPTGPIAPQSPYGAEQKNALDALSPPPLYPRDPSRAGESWISKVPGLAARLDASRRRYTSEAICAPASDTWCETEDVEGCRRGHGYGHGHGSEHGRGHGYGYGLLDADSQPDNHEIAAGRDNRRPDRGVGTFTPARSELGSDGGSGGTSESSSRRNPSRVIEWCHSEMLEAGRARTPLVPPLNFELVALGGLYRSGHPNERNFGFLRTLGLKSILYLGTETYRSNMRTFAEEEGIRVFQVGLESNKEPFDEMDQGGVRQCLEIILDTRNAPILIHCNKGKYRVGCVVGCLRKVQGWLHASIFDEFARWAGDKYADFEFIEVFDPCPSHPTGSPEVSATT